MRDRKSVLSQAASLSATLYDWKSVEDFIRIVDDLNELISELPDDSRGHRERVFREWRESWVLSQFPVIHSAQQLRLVRAGIGRPDAEIDFNSVLIDLEVTEAPGEDVVPHPRSRIRGDDGPDRWRARIATIPRLLDAAAAKKVGKPYAPRSSLLVYLNIGGTFGIAKDEGEAHIRRFVTRFGERFRTVHVLWGKTVYSNRPLVDELLAMNLTRKLG